MNTSGVDFHSWNHDKFIETLRSHARNRKAGLVDMSFVDPRPIATIVEHLFAHGPHDPNFGAAVAGLHLEEAIEERCQPALISLALFYDKVLRQASFTGGSEISTALERIGTYLDEDARSYLRTQDLTMPVQHGTRVRRIGAL